MDKIYMDAKDQNVAANVVYYNGTDLKVFADSKCKNQIAANELFDLCLKGVIVRVGENSYAVPTEFKKESGIVKLNVTIGGTVKTLLSK